MVSTALQAVCVLSASLALPAPPSGPLQSLEDQETAYLEVQLDGRTLSMSREAQRDWLLRFQGPANAARYVQSIVIGERSRELGLAVSDAQVQERTESEIAMRIEQAFDNDPEGWYAELQQTERTAQGVREQRLIENRMQLEAEAVAKHDREVTPEQVEDEFSKRYGPGGLSWDVTPLSIRFLQPSPPDGTAPEERARLRRVAREELEARLAGLYAELQAGADFEVLLREHGEDLTQASTRARFPERFPSPDWPDEHIDAIQALPVGACAPPVYVRGSFHILRIDARHVTKLEDVAEEIQAELEARIASATEVQRVLSTALDGVQWSLLPALREHGPRPGSEPVLRIGDTDVSRQEYGDWLMGINGESGRKLFVEFELVKRLADEAGVAPTEDEVVARINRDMEDMIERVFGGRLDRFLQQNSVNDKAQFVESRMALVEHHQATENLIAVDREVTQEQVRGLWLQRYGEQGRAVRARVIELEVPTVDSDVDPKDSRAERDRLFAETEQLAARLVERIENGEDFATLATRHSAHNSQKNGGQLAGFVQPADWPAGVSSAVLAGHSGQVIGPVSDGAALGRVWVFEILEARDMPFESAQEELRAELLSTRVGVGDRAAWLNLLMRRVEISEVQ